MNKFNLYYLALILFCLVSKAEGYSGQLDQTFGIHGKVIANYNGLDDIVSNSVLQYDDKIIVVGQLGGPSNGIFAIVRYLPNGALDESFGSCNGVVTTHFEAPFNVTSIADAVLVQPDKKILVCGQAYDASSHQTLVLARYEPNGILDKTFNPTGKIPGTLVTCLPGMKFIVGITLAVQNDGKILVGGYTDTSELFIVRCQNDGKLDTTFNKIGFLVNNNATLAGDIAVQEDKKIVVAGPANVNEDYSPAQFFLARYYENGTADTSFNSNGVIVGGYGHGNSYAGDFVVQENDKVTIAGYLNVEDFFGNHLYLALARFNSSGEPDISFSQNGKALTFLNVTSIGTPSIVLQPDEKILVASMINNNEGQHIFVLARYLANGTLDTSFNATGQQPGIVFAGFGNPNSTSTDSLNVLLQDDEAVLSGTCSYNIAI